MGMCRAGVASEGLIGPGRTVFINFDLIALAKMPVALEE